MGKCNRPTRCGLDINEERLLNRSPFRHDQNRAIGPEGRVGSREFIEISGDAGANIGLCQVGSLP